MNTISEQVKKLRDLADYLSLDLSESFDFTDESNTIREAANTIETLSAQLTTINTKRQEL